MPLPFRALHTYTSTTKEAQQILKLFLKIRPCTHKKDLAGNAFNIQSSYKHLQERVRRQCLPFRALHTYTSLTKEAQQALKLFVKTIPCIHKKELAGNSLHIQSSYTYTSPTKEAQHALKLFLKIHPCTHKIELAGNALTIQNSYKHLYERVRRQCPYNSELSAVELVGPTWWGLCMYKNSDW